MTVTPDTTGQCPSCDTEGVFGSDDEMGVCERCGYLEFYTDDSSDEPASAPDTQSFVEPTTEQKPLYPLVIAGLVVLVGGGALVPIVGIPAGMALLGLALFLSFR